VKDRQISLKHPQHFEPSGVWEEELRELALRRQQALAMGGPEALTKLHAKGRMDARQRLEKLLDTGSFQEMGSLAGKGHYDAEGRFTRLDPSNSIVGTGRIDGRKVVLTVDDFSIRAGSSEASVADKWIYIERLAHQLRMPLVRLVDSAGGSVKLLMQLGGTKIPGYSNWPVNEVQQTVPVVGVALGSCAGLGAIKVLSSHFSVMVREQAQVMAAGPHVVRQAYAQEVDKNDLGGHMVHRKSALVHNEAEDEADALGQVKRFLSYLPRSVHHLPPLTAPQDDPGRADDWLKDAIPRDRRKIYDPRKILASVMDSGSLFEIGRYQGGSVITALARLNGIPVGVIANDPKVQGGAMTLQAAYKMERHVKLCSQFGLPVVNFVDQPGNQTGQEAEIDGTLLGALRVGEALHGCQSPWVSILIRRCFGMAGAMHAPKYGEALNLRYAWPSARWGSIPIEGGVMAAHKAEIDAAPDPVAKRAELEAFYLNMTSPFRTAEKFGILDIIDPRETRGILCDWVEDAWELVKTGRIEEGR
jgi:acetyl-CoA carboxylase carboxyltransferase component